jgi:hypothetical protein
MVKHLFGQPWNRYSWVLSPPNSFDEYHSRRAGDVGLYFSVLAGLLIAAPPEVAKNLSENLEDVAHNLPYWFIDYTADMSLRQRAKEIKEITVVDFLEHASHVRWCMEVEPSRDFRKEEQPPSKPRSRQRKSTNNGYSPNDIVIVNHDHKSDNKRGASDTIGSNNEQGSGVVDTKRHKLNEDASALDTDVAAHHVVEHGLANDADQHSNSPDDTKVVQIAVIHNTSATANESTTILEVEDIATNTASSNAVHDDSVSGHIPTDHPLRILAQGATNIIEAESAPLCNKATIGDDASVAQSNIIGDPLVLDNTGTTDHAALVDGIHISDKVLTVDDIIAAEDTNRSDQTADVECILTSDKIIPTDDLMAVEDTSNTDHAALVDSKAVDDIRTSNQASTFDNITNADITNIVNKTLVLENIATTNSYSYDDTVTTTDDLMVNDNHSTTNQTPLVNHIIDLIRKIAAMDGAREVEGTATDNDTTTATATTTTVDTTIATTAATDTTTTLDSSFTSSDPTILDSTAATENVFDNTINQ